MQERQLERAVTAALTASFRRTSSDWTPSTFKPSAGKDRVGSREIRDFVGSLVGHNASKGVFITTSSFTRDALDYSGTVPHHVKLLDGEQLAQLMIDFGVGVHTVETYEVKRIDTDYFTEA